jgi:2-(3-amino-3-carboxypropyl)histidine synthase
MRYDFEESKVQGFLKRHKVKRAAIQLPSGLRPKLCEILKVFKEAGVEPVVVGSTCHGACDLADVDAARLGCDVLVHYGHADMGLPTTLPVLYVEARVKESPLEAVKQALPKLGLERVGLLTTVQHIGHLKKVAELVRSHGIEPVIGNPGFRAKYPGQLLGCDLACARSIASRVDGYLYLGGGRFHPLGAAFATGKRVLSLDFSTGELADLVNMKGFLRARRKMIFKAAGGEKFGVVSSTKLGQARLHLAMELLAELRMNERKGELVIVDELNPESIGDFGFDALICAACPRIPIDDAERFGQPILTPFELRVMLGVCPLEPYEFDEVKEGDFEKRFKRAR